MNNEPNVDKLNDEDTDFNADYAVFFYFVKQLSIEIGNDMEFGSKVRSLINKLEETNVRGN